MDGLHIWEAGIGINTFTIKNILIRKTFLFIKKNYTNSDVSIYCLKLRFI